MGKLFSSQRFLKGKNMQKTSLKEIYTQIDFLFLEDMKKNNLLIVVISMKV